MVEFFDWLPAFVVLNVPTIWWDVGIWFWSVCLATIYCKHENDSNSSMFNRDESLLCIESFQQLTGVKGQFEKFKKAHALKACSHWQRLRYNLKSFKKEENSSINQEGKENGKASSWVIHEPGKKDKWNNFLLDIICTTIWRVEKFTNFLYNNFLKMKNEITVPNT